MPMTVNEIFTAIGFSIALMAPATAAEIKFIGSDIISVSGRIEAGDHLTISRIVLAKMPDSTTIILNSGGGFGKAAFMIGRTYPRPGPRDQDSSRRALRFRLQPSLVGGRQTRDRLPSTYRAARPAHLADVRALRVGQQIDGRLHGRNGRAKGNDRLGAPDRSGISDLRRPCPAAAVGTGEQPSMPPKPSINSDRRSGSPVPR